MNMDAIWRALALAMFVLLAAVPAAWAGQGAAKEPAVQGSAVQGSAVVVREVESPFEDALADLEDAIIAQGLKIDSRNHVVEMLERTGKDLGLPPSPYKAGLVLQFCSASLSHAAMRADPNNIAFCPYAVFVYELRDKPGRSVIGFRRLPQEMAKDDAVRKAMAAINALLTKIIDEAAGGF